MMYRGTYSPEFYRQLHRLVHAEFRSRRASARLGAALRRPWQLRVAHLRDAATIGIEGAARTIVRRRLARLARPGATNHAPTPLVEGVAATRQVEEAS